MACSDLLTASGIVGSGPVGQDEVVQSRVVGSLWHGGAEDCHGTLVAPGVPLHRIGCPPVTATRAPET